MRRPAFLRREVPLDYGRGRATPEDAKRALAKALKGTARHAARTDTEPTPICLIGQARSGRDYAAQRMYWLRKARGWGAQAWPERLREGESAMFIAPVAPESARRPREHPKPIVVPGFTDFDLDLAPETALAIVTSVWLSKVAVEELDAVVLTPPILERYSVGRLLGREVMDYGLSWPLPAVELDR